MKTCEKLERITRNMRKRENQQNRVQTEYKTVQHSQFFQIAQNKSKSF